MTRDKAYALMNASIDMRKRINTTQDEIDVWARAVVLSIGIEPLHSMVTARHKQLINKRRYRLLALKRIDEAIDNALIQFELERQ